MKKAFLTIDIEEWYHLDYLKDYDTSNANVETIPKIFDFLDMLDRLNIKATFFTLAEVAKKNADILLDIHERGHEIACHGLDHDLLYDKTNEEFKSQVIEAKQILDGIIGEGVVKGYRASCFSMDREKLDILMETGYSYDSSYITFAEHPLYGKLDLSDFEKVDDLIYKRGDFVEFEVPTYQVGKYNIPISGGGYMRLFPLSLNQTLIRSYLKGSNSFIFYLHPFELTNIALPFPAEISQKEKFRASVGRKNNLNKLEKILKMLIKNDVKFSTLNEEYKRTVVKEEQPV